MEAEAGTRAARRLELPALISAVDRRLAELPAPGRITLPEDSATVASAKQMRARARREALLQESRALASELASYEARGDLLAARRDLAERRRRDLERSLQYQQGLFDWRRNQENRALQQQARAAIQQSHPDLEPLARDYARLAARLTEVGVERARAAKRRDDVRQRSQRLTDDVEGVRARIRIAGLTDAIGLQLRRHRQSLPSSRRLHDQQDQREAEITGVQLEWVDLDERRSALSDLERATTEFLETLPAAAPQPDRDAEAARILAAEKELLATLVREVDGYLNELVQVDTLERDWAARCREFADFIDERILWIPSSPPLWEAATTALPGELRRIGNRSSWALATSPNWAIGPLALLISTMVGIGVLYRFRRQLLEQLTARGAAASKSSCVSLLPTWIAFFSTVLLALPGPAAALMAGWVLDTAFAEDTLGHHLGATLDRVAWLLLAAETARQIVRSGGLAEAHFGWKSRALAKLRRALEWNIRLGLPAAWLALGFERWSPGESTVGRVAFVGAAGVLVATLGKLMHPGRGVLTQESIRSRGFFVRTRGLWFVLAVGIPVFFGVLAILGYYFTGLQLAGRFLATLGLVFGLVFVNAMVLRALMLTRRRLAIEQARERSAAKEANRSADGQDPPAAIEKVTDVSTVNEQTRHLLRSATGVAIIVGVWLVWVSVLPALGFLREITMWSETVSVTESSVGPDGNPEVRTFDQLKPVTLADLILACILFFFTGLAARGLPGLLSLTLLKRLSVGEGERYAIATVTRYAILAIGISAAFASIGVGWSKLQWLIAAMGIGLGFGLQEIFANFISGLIILFERPVRVGDIVTVGTQEGRITQIRMRATTILDWDRKEIIIPNKEFITARVTNWTLTDQITRLTIPVGIAYGSDTEKARELLLRTAKENPDVLPDPEPHVVFRAFGESSLDFQLRVFLLYREAWIRAIDSLHAEIDTAFREAGIEIAFPQRDIHVRSGGSPQNPGASRGPAA